MVSGIDAGLIIRANGPISSAEVFPRGEEDRSPAAANDTTPGEGGPFARVGLAGGETGGFASGSGGDEEEGPFFSEGLNGLLAPSSIAIVQDENGERGEQEDGAQAGTPPTATATEGDSDRAAEASGSGEEGDGPNELSEEEEELVQDLKARDAEVRRHEQAHKAVGGQYAGSISYTYQSGPDGRQYAVGGEVSIDASPIAGDPEATIRKLEQVRRAALAPAEPSSADRSVASAASQGIQQARVELAEQNAAEQEEALSGGEEGETQPTSETSPDAAPSGNTAAQGAGSDIGGAENPFAIGQDGFGGGGDGNDRSPFAPREIGNIGETGNGFGVSNDAGDQDGDSQFVGAFDIASRNASGFTPSLGRATLDISV